MINKLKRMFSAVIDGIIETKHFKAQNYVDSYLANATDIRDLEQRMRELQSRGIA